MKRRTMIAFGLATAGSTLLPQRALSADIAPIAIAEVGRGDSRRVVRIYPGEQRDSFIMHVRQGGRAYTRRMQFEGNLEGTFSGLQSDGTMRVATRDYQGTVSITNRDMTGFNIEGIGDVTVGPPATAYNAPLYLMIIVIAAFILGRETRTMGASSSGGDSEAEAEEAEEEEESDGIIASPECDGPPMRLC